MSLAPVRSQDADRKGKGPGIDPGDPFDPADSCLLKWPQCCPCLLLDLYVILFDSFLKMSILSSRFQGSYFFSTGNFGLLLYLFFFLNMPFKILVKILGSLGALL